jgi:hypothetical protein
MLTGNDVTRVHCVLVLDEAEAIHELDLGDLAGAMGREMGLDFSLGGVARKVAQVKAGRRDFRHREVVGGEALRNLAWKGGERMLTVNECQARNARGGTDADKRVRAGNQWPERRVKEEPGRRPGGILRAQYNSCSSYLGDVVGWHWMSCRNTADRL